MKLKDRVAIVTGGGKGIGEEICLGLAKEGAKIVIAEIDIANSENAKKKILDTGSEAIIVKTDVSKKDSINEMVEKAIQTFGKIDILFNNAAFSDFNYFFNRKNKINPINMGEVIWVINPEDIANIGSFFK